MNKSLFSALALSVVSSCATLTGPTTHQIKFETNVPNATIRVEGSGEYTSPAIIAVKGKSSYSVIAEKQCYRTNSTVINGEPRILAGVVGNIFNFTGFLGMAVDYFDGAFFKMPQQSYISLQLNEDSDNPKCKALIKAQ